MTPSRPVLAMAAGLFAARGADLLRYLRQRLGSDADARDLAQEAYLRFIRLGNPDRIDNPEAYLFRIAGNLLWERKLQERKLSAYAPLDEIPTVEQTPLDLTQAAELGEKLKRALSALPFLQRAVLVLHLRDDITCGEISAQTGISTSMVKKHLHSALATCRRRLRDYE